MQLLSFITFPFYAVIFLSLLIFWDIVQRIAFLFGIKTLEKIVFFLNYSILSSLRLLGTKIETPDLVNIDSDKPLIIISNHQSMFDMPLLYVLFGKLNPRYIAKKELSKWIPSISFCLRNTGAALINRKNPKQAIPEIVALAKRMQEQKFAVVIFPEGTRSRDGNLKKFKDRGVKTLLKEAPETSVLPIRIDGTWRLTQNKLGIIPLFQNIEIKIGEVINRNGKTEDEIFEQVQQIIKEL